MTSPGDMQARNQRVALILIATFAVLCAGSVLYIDWFHTMGPGTAMTRTK